MNDFSCYLRMRRFVLIFFLCFLGGEVSAQSGSVFNIFQNKRERSKAVMIGFKGGFTLPRVGYSEEDYKNAPQKIVVSPAFGVFVEIPIVKTFSVAPEFMYITRGVNHDKIPFRNKLIATYKLSVNCLDFRLPFIYRFGINKVFQPYIFAAPDIAVPINGKKQYYVVDSDNHPVYPFINEDITGDDISSIDISALLGVGVRVNIDFQKFTIVTKIDIGYNYGFINNNGEANNPVTKEFGKRYHRALECMVSVGLPLRFSKKDTFYWDFGNKYGYDRKY